MLRFFDRDLGFLILLSTIGEKIQVFVGTRWLLDNACLYFLPHICLLYLKIPYQANGSKDVCLIFRLTVLSSKCLACHPHPTRKSQCRSFSISKELTYHMKDNIVFLKTDMDKCYKGYARWFCKFVSKWSILF